VVNLNEIYVKEQQMGKRRWFLAALVTALAVTVGISGCQGKAASTTASGGASGTSSGERPFYQIEMFNTYANYMGINQGWWGKMLKDELNMELNIIAPNVAGTGDALYQTRSAAGNLGDSILTFKARMIDLHKAGLLLDLKPYLDSGKYPNLQKLNVAYEKFAEMFDGKGIYAIPGRVSQQPATEAAGRGFDPEQGMFVRFDWYLEIGAPPIKSFDDLLNACNQMVKLHPVDDKGDKTYAFSAFPDWDGGNVRAARELLYLFGYTTGNDWVWMSNDGTKTINLTDDNGLYYQALKMFNQAYRMGILDPDSSTQNWDTIKAKWTDGRVAFSWWYYGGGSIFDRIDLTKNKPYAMIPFEGGQLNNVGYNPYGLEGNAFAIGSKAKYPERIMELYEWLASPEGSLIYNQRIEGVTYEMRNGEPFLTEFGLDTNADKLAPAELGGGSFNNGIQRINYPLTHQDDPNPAINGYSTNSSLWPSTVKLNENEFNLKWQEFYQADNPLDLLKKRNLLAVTPGNDYTAPTEPSEIITMRNQLRAIFQPAGWQMIYAANDAAFEKIWRDMKAQLNDFGFKEVTEWDMQITRDKAEAIQRTLQSMGK
jgi:multiple sugar transport system substrate-binding protein/putative aldouronate transport system substrate-binding protein